MVIVSSGGNITSMANQCTEVFDQRYHSEIYDDNRATTGSILCADPSAGYAGYLNNFYREYSRSSDKYGLKCGGKKQ